MAIDFTKIQSLLSKNADEIEKPKPLPPGQYQFIVTGHEFGESAQKKTPFVSFKVRPVAPGPDVDQTALAQVKEWNKKEMKYDFYITEDALFRLKDFIGHCGIGTSGRPLDACIPELTNQSFTGVVAQSISEKDHETVYANIVSSMAA